MHCQPSARTAIVAVICCHLSAIAAAAEPTRTDWSGKLSFEADGGYDSDPTQGTAQGANRVHGDRDMFAEGVAAGSLSFPVVPVTLKGRWDDREYSHSEAEDHVLGHSEADVPIKIQRTTLVPQFSVDDEWYGDSYYSTTDRTELRWTQDWQQEWSSDLIPFLARTAYRPPNRTQDGTEVGADASLTWWVPGHAQVRALTIDVGGSHYDSHTIANSYHQARLGIDLLYRLPWAIDLDLDLEWLPTWYDPPIKGMRGERRDRTYQGDLVLIRPLMGGFDVTATCLVTNDQSNRTMQQFHEVVISAGIRWTLR